MTVGEVAKRDGKWLPAFHWHHQHWPAGFYTDADTLAAYGKSEDKRKFVTEPAEQRAAANKKRWSSAKTWGKATTNVLSLDEESWTAMIEKGGDGLLEDADKTSDVEWAMQLTLLAAIVVGAKAGSKMGESRGGRANAQRVSAEEIRAEAREQGIDLPDDSGFQMRLNELARNFNEMPEEQKGRTLREINKGNVNNAQAEYNEAKTPIDRLRAKTKLDRVKKELAKYEGEYMKKGDIALEGKSGYEGDGGGFLDVIEEEAAEKEPLLEKEKAKEESGTKGLLDLTGKLNKKGGSFLDRLREQGEEKKRQEAGKDPIKSDKLEEELDDGEEGNFEGDELKEDPKPRDLIEKSKTREEADKEPIKIDKLEQELNKKAEKERIEKSLYSRTWEDYAQERELNAQRGRNAFAESWESQNAREMGREAFEKGRNEYMQKQRPELEDDDILDLDFDFDEDLDQPFDRDEQNEFRFENEEVDVDFDENLDEPAVEEMNLEEEIFEEEPEETDPLIPREGDVIELDEESNSQTRADMRPSTKTAATLLGAASGITSVIADGVDTVNSSETTDSSGNARSDVQGATPSRFNIKETLNTKNLDELFVETLMLSKLVYDPLISSTTLFRITEDVYNPVLFSAQGTTLFVAFKGTQTMGEWFSDFDIRVRKFSDYPLFNQIMNLDNRSDLECHKGFLDAMEKTYETVRNKLNEYRKFQDVIFTGHSLGGALATLFYYIYERDVIKKDEKIKVSHTITFGSPRVFKNVEKYVIRYNAQCPNYIRIFNSLDLVPYLPARRNLKQFTDFYANIVNKPSILKEDTTYSEKTFSFVHVGIPLCLDKAVSFNDINNFIYYSLQTSNDLIKYILDRNNISNNNTEEMLTVMGNKGFREQILAGIYTCIPYYQEFPNINPFVLSNFLFDNMEKVETYAEKCAVLEPMKLDKLMIQTSIPKDIQDISLNVFTSISYNTASIAIKAHTLGIYQRNLDILITQEVIDKREILSVDKKNSIDDIEKTNVTNPPYYKKETETILEAETKIEQREEKVEMTKGIFILPPPVGIFIYDNENEIDNNNYQFIKY